MTDVSMVTPPAIFESLLHLLEISVVVGIGVIVYLTKRNPKSKAEMLQKESSLYQIAPDEIVIFKEDRKKE